MRLYGLTIRGKYNEWSFPIYAKPEHAEDWMDDGLLVEEIVNTIPVWINNLGLAGLWCFFQDLRSRK